jgi:hypothetical protein
MDDLPEQAFMNVGTNEDAIEKGKKLLEAAKDSRFFINQSLRIMHEIKNRIS